MFVHLHNHSHYSLLDGLAKIDDLVDRAKELGLPALALTDHGNLYGAIEFYKKCQSAGIKPIVGVEAYVAARSRFDKEANIDSKRFHLTLLAKNAVGYKNLVKLVTKANLEGYYYKPRIDKELMREHHEGVICLSGCMASELSRAILARNYEEAKKIANEYREIFGPENYFIEIFHHPKIERYPELKEQAIKLAHELGIPLIATQDAHYLQPDDTKAHDTLVAIGTNTDADDNNRYTKAGDDFSLIDEATMREHFKDAPEAVDNTLKIAEACDLKLELGKWVFPKFQLTLAETPEEELRKFAESRLPEYLERNPDRKEEAATRLAYELEVIINKGYAPYFLVVADIFNFTRAQGIFTNTRGSAAGCFTSHLIGISSVDPLYYNLPFERFLNPDRPSPPDIDMDFADRRRDEVIDYVKKKYGEDHVAQIGTFGSMMARGAVRDVARALGHPYAVGDKISNLIPMGSQGFPMTIDHALEITPELKQLYDTDTATKEIIDLAKKIEGNARHISVHAAGVVISPTPLTDFVPLQFDPKGGKIITQFDMYVVEEAGLLKFDFLGIRNLSIIEGAIRIIEKTRGEKIDIEKIPLDDKKTFIMLTAGHTIGLFQLNGTGMTRALKELKPTRVEDINVMVALYRPGPMDNIYEYIARKHGKKPTKFLHPKMKSYLAPTFGVLVYQDDLLMTAIEVAGYNWGEVDKFRKAVGKKIPEEMKKQHVMFVEGCIKHSDLTKEKAEEIWNLFEPFQGYGFNKAHAASYGRVAYQTAYLKANYPGEYMTAALSAESGNIETIAEIISECKLLGIPVLPPDINESFSDFTVIKAPARGPRKDPAPRVTLADCDKIRFGLVTIKNLGAEIAEVIVRERKTRGPFKSFSDLLERITHRNLNKKSLEALIKSGAMDCFSSPNSKAGERGTLLANLDAALEYNRERGKLGGNQDSLFSAMTDKASVPDFKLKPAPDISAKEKLAWEKELLGLYVSGHPLEEFREKIEAIGRSITKIKGLKDGTATVVAGVLEEIKLINTKKGDRMCFAKLTDFNDSIELVIFSRTFAECRELLEPEKCVAIKGKLSLRNGEPSLVVEGMKELTR